MRVFPHLKYRTVQSRCRGDRDAQCDVSHLLASCMTSSAVSRQAASWIGALSILNGRSNINKTIFLIVGTVARVANNSSFYMKRMNILRGGGLFSAQTSTQNKFNLKQLFLEHILNWVSLPDEPHKK